MRKGVFGVVSIVFLGIAMLFLPLGITGYSIANISSNKIGIFGGLFFLIAIVTFLIYLRKNEENEIEDENQ